MIVDFKRLAASLAEKRLMDKAPAAMSKEEIEELCRIILFCAKAESADDVPF